MYKTISASIFAYNNWVPVNHGSPQCKTQVLKIFWGQNSFLFKMFFVLHDFQPRVNFSAITIPCAIVNAFFIH